MSIGTNRLDRSNRCEKQRYQTLFDEERVQHFLRRQGLVTNGNTPLSKAEIERRLRRNDQQNTSDLFAQSVVEKALGIDRPYKKVSGKNVEILKDQLPQLILYENACAITMRYHGFSMSKSNKPTDEILIMQSHTSMGTRIVFKGLIGLEEEFTFKSHRFMDRSFVCSIYINGIIDGHISACCEEGYLRQNHVQYRRNLCRLVSINGGTPCDACKCNVMIESSYGSEDEDFDNENKYDPIIGDDVVTMKNPTVSSPPITTSPVSVNPKARFTGETANRPNDSNGIQSEKEKKVIAEKEQEGNNLTNQNTALVETVDEKDNRNVIKALKNTTDGPGMKKLDNEDDQDRDKDQSIGQSEMQQLLTKYLEEFTEARKSQPKSDPSTHASVDHPVTTADSNDPLLPRSVNREKAYEKAFSGHNQTIVTGDNAEGFGLVWLDDQMNQNEDMLQSEEKLRSLVNALQTYSDAGKAIESIRKMQQQSIFLILSGKFANQLLGTSKLIGLNQLDSIYIFCKDEKKHKDLLKKEKRTRGLFTDIDSLCLQLKEDMKHILYNLLQFSVSSSISDDKSNAGQEKMKVKFLCSQLHRDLLFTMEYHEDARSELIRFCEQVYRNNEGELKHIQEFKEKYHTGRAIRWYTRESFLYKLLNPALIRQDVSVLCKFHFFLKDLHMQIEQLHGLYKQSLKDTTFTVYRGLRMSANDFEQQIRQEKGNLIAFDNFLSTSLKDTVARQYAAETTGNNIRTEAILLHITIKPDEFQLPFADIKRFSDFKNEDEILFSIGTVFRISDVAENKDHDGVWLVKLVSVSENDNLFKNDTQKTLQTLLSFFKRLWKAHSQTQKHANIATSLANIARIYYKQGYYQSSLENYIEARNELGRQVSPDPLSMATYNSNVAMVYDTLEEYDQALESYGKALEIRSQCCESDDPVLINTFRMIGHLHFKKQEWTIALQQYEKARTVLLSSDSSVEKDKTDPQLLATVYIDSALVYQKLKNYEETLKYLENARLYQLKYLPDTHPILAFVYNNIGAMCYHLKIYDQALENHLQCLKIEQGSLPKDNFAFISTYRNIAKTFEKMEKYSKAVEYAELAVNQSKIHREENDPNHQSLIQLHEDMRYQMTIENAAGKNS